jgi:membrane-bound hydrogenase subunit mbhJ
MAASMNYRGKIMEENIEEITINPESSDKSIIDSVVDKIRSWSRINSPWAIHYNSGSCNGCDIELLTLVTPRYDVERLGIKLQGSPRHADVLIVTGAVTLQSKDRLIRIYNQMPEPKFVIALGSCGISGGVFHDCYCVEGGVADVIPVDVFVPGCPPRPEAMINGVATLLAKIKAGNAKKESTGPTIFAMPEIPVEPAETPSANEPSQKTSLEPSPVSEENQNTSKGENQ